LFYLINPIIYSYCFIGRNFALYQVVDQSSIKGNACQTNPYCTVDENHLTSAVTSNHNNQWLRIRLEEGMVFVYCIINGKIVQQNTISNCLITID